MIGHDIEGPLHAPDSVLAFFASSAGVRERPLHGERAETGEPMLVHWTKGGAVPRDPDVEVFHEGDDVSVKLGGTEKQVKRVLKGLRKKYGDAVPDLEALPAEAKRIKQPETVRMGLQISLVDTRRFCVKTALAAGSMAWGERFITSELAGNLRRILHAPDSLFTPDVEVVDLRYVELAMEQARQMFPRPLPDISVPERGPDAPWISQVILAPIPRPGGVARIATFTHVLGVPTPIHGVLVDGSLPGEPILPLVLREQLGEPAELLNIDQLAFAQLVEQDRRPEDLRT